VSLARLAQALRHLEGTSAADSLATMDWLPHQARYLETAAEHRWRMLRTGNRLGKTTVAAAETIQYALGIHPHDPRPPIREQWAITVSWSQSLAVQEALWRLAPKGRLAPGQRYDFRRGFGAANPSLLFDNGSVIRIRTTQQGSLNLAGFQVGRIWFDEPPLPSVWDECVARTRTAGGLIAVTLTPIGRDCTFLRELVELGKLQDIHQRLTPDALVHTRSGRRYCTDDGEACTAEWIEAQEELCLPYTVPVRIHGEWDMRLTDRFFGAFVSDPSVEGSHVADPPPYLDLVACVGMDHGYARGNAASVLIGVDESTIQKTGYPTVWVLDEGWSPEVTTPDHDADNLLGMLSRQRWRWSELAHVYGDIPTRAGAGRKGNLDIADSVRRRLGLRHRDQLHPRIYTAKRGRRGGAGSVEYGCGWLHRRMVMGQFFISPRCVRLIEGIDKWQGEKESEHKHLIDGLRYGLTHYIRGGRKSARGARLVVR